MLGRIFLDKPEPGAAFLLGYRGIRLLELLKNLALIPFGDAWAGVVHRDREGIRWRSKSYRHFAGVGEFNRIAHEVEQNLSEPGLVAVRGAACPGMPKSHQPRSCG